MNYYKRHLGDYAAATRHLSMLEHGAYTLLLDLYYITEKPLPTEERAVYRLVGARSKEEREAVSQVLQEFFELRPDGWHQTRCDEELTAKQAKSERNREIGRRGGRPKKETQTVSESDTQTVAVENPNGFQKETQTVSENNPSHKPLAISQEKEESLSPTTASTGCEAPAAVAERDPPPAGDYLPSTTRHGLLAKLLRQQGIQVAAGNPEFRRWVDAGLTDDEALAAVEAARQAKPAPEPIPWAYLARVLTTQRNAAAAGVPRRREAAVDQYGVPL